MESGDAQNEASSQQLLYKKSSYWEESGSRSGLDKGINVVDGKLTDKSEHPLHSVLHHNAPGEEHIDHTHLHVHIEVKEAPSDSPPPPPADSETQQKITATTSRTSRATKKSLRLREMSKHGSFRSENSDFFDTSKVIDEDFERKHEKHLVKVSVNKGTLKSIQEMFPNDERRQENFLESVLAAQHVRDLTTRYGSKNKNVRQFFLEAVDADTRLALFGSENVEEAQLGLKKLDGKKGHSHSHTVLETASVMTLNDDSTATPTFPTESSTSHIQADYKPEETVPLIGVWSKKNFWESLERLEWEQAPDDENACNDGKGNPLFEIYGPKWKRSQRFANQADSGSIKTSEVKNDLEMFPDKYLESDVQEVQKSEAVRRLWDVVNGQLELFEAKDPLAYEMFGTLYDEVRDFVRLPEEDIIDFNNGIWEPEPLDEKKILSMEPYEKLMTRFSVYQKAFCFLAQHFELITPIFGDIKQAYEDVFEKGEKETIEVEKEQMEELELRQSLGKHVRHTDKAGHRLLIQVKAETHALQEHIQWQHHTLHTILGMLWKMRSSLKLTSWAVSQLKNMHKSKIEALAKEIVSTQQGQMLFDMALPGKYTEIMRRIRDQSDPKEIRRVLLAVRRQLRAAHRKLVVFEADYADTVPRTEFEVPQKKFALISKKNQTLQDACNSLKADRQQKKQVIAGLKSDIYETSGLVKDLTRKPTPRPSWTKISNEWPAGESKFAQIKEGHSTRAVINKVVEELSGKKVGELTVYIAPRGRGDHIPVYLRYDRPLLQRNFTAAEATLLIKDIWRKRADIVSLYRKIKQARRDEEEGAASYPDDLQYDFPIVGTFPEFVTEYFKKRCHLEQMRMEWVYNLVEACKVHSVDAKLAQFEGILEGSIDESIYHLFQMQLEKLQEFMYARANESQEHKGYLEWPNVVKYLTDLCPNKTEDQINTLNGLGASSYGVRGTWAVVRAQNLFEADDDGKESDFVEMLHQQFEEERKLYIRDIYMEMLTELGISEKLLEHEDDPVWQTDVSMHMFYACCLSIDQTLPDTKLISYLAWVYLGVTALPGVTSLGTKLVDFLRERAHFTEAELEKYNEDEDVEFENCIREIKDYEEDEATMDKLDLKKRRLTTKKLRFASLRQVMDRLYSGPFVRFGQRVEKSKAAEAEPEVAAEPKEHKQRHHKHHKHHKHSHKKQTGQQDDDEGDFIS